MRQITILGTLYEQFLLILYSFLPSSILSYVFFSWWFQIRFHVIHLVVFRQKYFNYISGISDFESAEIFFRYFNFEGFFLGRKYNFFFSSFYKKKRLLEFNSFSMVNTFKIHRKVCHFCAYRWFCYTTMNQLQKNMNSTKVTSLSIVFFFQIYIWIEFHFTDILINTCVYKNVYLSCEFILWR